MTKRPKKRSVTLKGHRTSVSLEDAFWHELQAIAAQKGQPINALVAEIDSKRGIEIGLASALRLHVLASLRDRLPKDE